MEAPSVTLWPSMVKVDSEVTLLASVALATVAKLPNPVAGRSTSSVAATNVVTLRASALYEFLVMAIFFIFFVSSLRLLSLCKLLKLRLEQSL